jgi:PTS system mannose-specific IID component
MPAWHVRLMMFLRSFAIQGSWNFRTLIGHGFAFAMLPALRTVYRGRHDELSAAALRHTQIFNSHPYLVGVALGAVSRLEAEHEDPNVIERFKSAVRSSLGSLGDGLVWAGWRPACALLGLVLVFGGAPWWVGPLAFLVVYNMGHVALRAWGFRIGFRWGRDVGHTLRKAHLADAQQDVARAGVFMLGVLMPLLVARAGEVPGSSWWFVCALLAILGLRFGTRARTPIIGGIAAVLIIGLLAGLRG